MYPACWYYYAAVAACPVIFAGSHSFTVEALRGLLDVTLPAKIGAGYSLSTSSVRRGVHLLLKEKDSGCMFKAATVRTHLFIQS